MDWSVSRQEQRRSLINTVIKLGFQKIRGVSWVNEKLLAFQEDFTVLFVGCYRQSKESNYDIYAGRIWRKEEYLFTWFIAIYFSSCSILSSIHLQDK
jgi:hypothetical protein